MNDNPLISIVTPSFNQGAYIRKTLQSVLSQDYGNFEYWVIDGGSTDDTLSIVREFAADKRLRWVSEGDRGQSHAINKGIERSSGRIFNWINSDDYLEEGCLAEVARLFADGRASVATGRCRKFDDLSGETNGFLKLEAKRSAEETILIGRCCQPSTFFAMDVVKEFGGVREDLHCAMDLHFWFRYLVSRGTKGIARTNKVLAHFREHSASKSARLNHQFKDEINGIYLDLFRFLKAPDYLEDYLRHSTTTNLAPTAWKPGPDFDRERLFSLYCSKLAKKFYYDEANVRAKTWLKRSMGWKFRFGPLRFYLKLLFKN